MKTFLVELDASSGVATYLRSGLALAGQVGRYG